VDHLESAATQDVSELFSKSWTAFPGMGGSDIGILTHLGDKLVEEHLRIVCEKSAPSITIIVLYSPIRFFTMAGFIRPFLLLTYICVFGCILAIARAFLSVPISISAISAPFQSLTSFSFPQYYHPCLSLSATSKTSDRMRMNSVSMKTATITTTTMIICYKKWTFVLLAPVWAACARVP
jgi:hypothetical protein